ncbi:cupin domain-containing protein [Pandoraea sp. 64-18]|uniref:cupin domain-containing protein n=1 Tax=Pandoraea sp. 64-18 TaxID=1895806 RepID=UPI000AC41445|nr:cupin domain-containing protein [Pandoraea sp. 64-18]
MPELQRAMAPCDRPRSFLDLKAFASDARQGTAPATSASDDRFLASRRLADLLPGPVTVGVIALDAANGAVSSHPADEFVIVSEGAIMFQQGERAFTLGPGGSAVLPRGSAFMWSTQGSTSIVFMRCEGGNVTDRSLVPIDPSPSLAPSGAPAAELLLTPAPVCRNFTDFRSSDATFTCGTWDSTPYHRIAMRYAHYELMHLLEGSVTFVDDTGRSGTFSRGDIFLVEQRAQCSWESRGNVAKVYAIYRPT